MKYLIAAAICCGLAGCAARPAADRADNLSVDDATAILLRYTRVPAGGYPKASSLLVGASGVEGPFSDLLGHGISAHELASFIRESKNAPGGPIIFIEVPADHPEVVLSRARGARLTAIDEALTEAGADTNSVQVIFCIQPPREPQDHDERPSTQSAGEGH